MKRRIRIKNGAENGGLYFASPSSELEFIHSGATILDCVLGGGWPLGRVVNIVGDKSTGKTLLAIESMVNFARQYRKGKIRYLESEAAFSPTYAASLGLPLGRVEFARKDGAATVEVFYKDLRKFLDKLDGQVGLYVLDSLDALSDEAEMEREFGQDSYGTGKAKRMSQLFRQITGDIESSKVCLMIISQVRDKIGISFGRNYTRSGGRALDFYSSQVIHLAHIGEISRTVNGIKRTVGVRVKAQCTKNKINLPFRRCEFPILFAYGIEDLTAGLDWLHEHKKLGEVGMSIKDYKLIGKRALFLKMDEKEQRELAMEVSKAVMTGWREVEQSFLPSRSKYGRT